MLPAEALGQIASANGFTSESDYDSDDLRKGPYADDGGEAGEAHTTRTVSTARSLPAIPMQPAERVTTLEIHVICDPPQSHYTIHLPLSWKRWPEG